MRVKSSLEKAPHSQLWKMTLHSRAGKKYSILGPHLILQSQGEITSESYQFCLVLKQSDVWGFLNLFIYLFLAALSLRCGAWASHCGGFSSCRTWALGAWASVVLARGLGF